MYSKKKTRNLISLLLLVLLLNAFHWDLPATDSSSLSATTQADSITSQHLPATSDTNADLRSAALRKNSIITEDLTAFHKEDICTEELLGIATHEISLLRTTRANRRSTTQQRLPLPHFAFHLEHTDHFVGYFCPPLLCNTTSSCIAILYYIHQQDGQKR